jgi:hypothetical protein
MADKGHERRLELRADPEGKVEAQYITPGPQVKDISASGIYLFESRPFARGQTIELKLRLADGEEFRIKGMVRRVDAGTGMGIEFINLTHHDRKRLRQFISQLKPAAEKITADEDI